MRSSRRGLAAFAVAAVLLLGLAFHFVNLTFDDAFISFRYAENLAEGRGLVFTPGERVEGYSNPLWTVLLAIPTALGAGRWELGMLVVAKCAGVAIALATLWVVRDLTTRDDPSKSSGWLALLYTAGVAPFALWSVGALETPLVTLFILLAVRAFVDEEREGAREPSFPHSPVWFLLAALTRPEPLTLFGVAWVFRAIVRVRARSFGLREQMRFVLPFALPYAAFLAFRLRYYGDLLPNTYYAKRFEDPMALVRGKQYLLDATADLGLGAVLLLAGIAVVIGRGMSRRFAFVLAMIGAQLAAVYYEGGDWMPAERLLVPALPLLGVLLDDARGVLLGVARSGPSPPSRRDLPAWLAREERLLAIARRVRAPFAALVQRVRIRPPAGRALANVAVASALGLAVVGGYRATRIRGLASGFSRLELTHLQHFGVARWMRKHTDPGGLLAIGEAGIIPYYTHSPVLDMFGLMDRHIGHLAGERHQKFDAAYVLSRRPRYVLVPLEHRADGSVYSVYRYGMTLLADPTFLRDYEVLHAFEGESLYLRVGDGS